ncbi:hypothetical protein D3C80_808260 [compost metagenome]
MIRVIQFERQAQHGRNRCQRDIAFVPGQAHAQHLFALPLTHADGADVRNGPGIGTGFRAGQGETRDLVAARQAWQVMVFLFVSTVMLQQFTGAEGVWHADGDGQNTGNTGQFLQHASLSIRREVQAAVLFLDDHREEAVFFQVRPQFRGQIGQFVGDLEVVGHAASFFHRAVNKRLLFGGQLRFRVIMQLVPVRRPAEQIAFPPGGTGFDRFLFGGGHRRHYLAERTQRRCRQHRTAQ